MDQKTPTLAELQPPVPELPVPDGESEAQKIARWAQQDRIDAAYFTGYRAGLRSARQRERQEEAARRGELRPTPPEEIH